MSPDHPILVVTKIDKQGIYLVHKVTLISIGSDNFYKYGVYCSYKTAKYSGLLWAQYLNSSLIYAKRFSYLMADHLDFAPLWAKYRSRKTEPISAYWDQEARRIEKRIFQLQESAIIRRDPTDDPSGL